MSIGQKSKGIEVAQDVVKEFLLKETSLTSEAYDSAFQLSQAENISILYALEKLALLPEAVVLEALSAILPIYTPYQCRGVWLAFSRQKHEKRISRKDYSKRRQNPQSKEYRCGDA